MDTRTGTAGQVAGTPYFQTYKEATLYMFQLTKEKNYTDIYNMSEQQYKEYCL